MKALKLFLVIGAVIVVLLALTSVFVYQSLTGSETTPALLYVNSGVVEVNQGKGWVSAVHEMELGQGDSIRTLDGTATVVLFEGDVIRLASQTTITLSTVAEKTIALRQERGETWNQVAKLTGTRDYSVETPNTVATVRGTSFNVQTETETDDVVVGDGVVSVTGKKSNKVHQAKEKTKVRVSADGVAEGRLSKEDKRKIVDSWKEDMITIKELRERELRKHQFLVEKAQEKYGVTDGQVEEFLVQLDLGKVNLDELESQIPVELKSLTKLRSMTERVIVINQKIQRLEREE